MLKGTKPTAAQLVKRDGRFFLHIQIGGEAPEPIEPDDFLGVDVGIAKIATTSDEPEGHSGKPVEKVRRKHNLQRKRLQRKGTKGAKKKLGRLAGKEARFRAMRTTASARRSSRPPKTPDAASPLRTSRAYADG